MADDILRQAQDDRVLRKAQDDRVLRQAQDDRDPDPILTGRNGKLQRRRRVRRKLFGKVAKAAFLESFACTANAAASAAAVGFSVGAVFTHRRTDAEFRDQYWAALEQAVGKLVALRIQHEIERAEGRLEPGIEAAMDGPPDARQIADLVKLMAALRDLTRNLGGPSTGSGQAQRGGRAAAPQAGLDEVCEALAKRLKAFPPSPPPEASASADEPPSFETGLDRLTPPQDERERPGED